MSNVIPFERPITEPHGHGKAFCIACNHNWQAVAPVGVTELECPQCKTMKGRYTFAFAPSTEKVWECGCGNQLFNFDMNGIFCPNCGVYQTFPRNAT